MDGRARVALITGGSGGIGRTVALNFARQGMPVALAGRSDRVVAAAEDLARADHRAIGIRTDVTSAAEVEALFEAVEVELGPIWVLVNAAGVLPVGTAADTPESDWDAAMGVIAKGTFLCSRAVVRRMTPRGAGRIVNVSSISSVVSRSGQIAYSTAKAAVNHFTRCLAMETAALGITVNAVLPGSTRGEMLAEFLDRRGLEISAITPSIPDGRLADPREHAALIAFLASDEAAHVTGQVIAVDGGQSQFMPFR